MIKHIKFILAVILGIICTVILHSSYWALMTVAGTFKDIILFVLLTLFIPVYFLIRRLSDIPFVCAIAVGITNAIELKAEYDYITRVMKTAGFPNGVEDIFLLMLLIAPIFAVVFDLALDLFKLIKERSIAQYVQSVLSIVSGVIFTVFIHNSYWTLSVEAETNGIALVIILSLTVPMYYLIRQLSSIPFVYAVAMGITNTVMFKSKHGVITELIRSEEFLKDLEDYFIIMLIVGAVFTVAFDLIVDALTLVKRSLPKRNYNIGVIISIVQSAIVGFIYVFIIVGPNLIFYTDPKGLYETIGFNIAIYYGTVAAVLYFYIRKLTLFKPAYTLSVLAFSALSLTLLFDVSNAVGKLDKEILGGLEYSLSVIYFMIIIGVLIISDFIWSVYVFLKNHTNAWLDRLVLKLDNKAKL